MNVDINGKPSFGYMNAELEPGESIIAEADAMASMHGDVDMHAKLNGNPVSALLKKTLGRESLFINKFSNNTQETKCVTFSKQTPGDVVSLDLNNESFCLQPGAYIASTSGVKLGLKWAGFSSFIGREGLFKLVVKGTGTVWFGAYGGIIERKLEDECVVDTSHLVGYEPNISLHMQLAGGAISSLFGGEGLVTRLEGTGKYYIQTRSVNGLGKWLNTKID